MTRFSLTEYGHHPDFQEHLGTASGVLVDQDKVPVGGWEEEMLRDLSDRLSGESLFPCVFAKNAYRKKLIKFLFVSTMDEPEIDRLVSGLCEYVRLSRDWDGTLNSAYPLVIAFSKDAVSARSVAGYHAAGWDILQLLHERDPAKWPDDVGRDPDAPDWSMCFDGMPIFCNMSTPEHENRPSRNLGERFVIVVNPRERFDVFAGETPAGRKARANIRHRITLYDHMSHSPQLASYGAGGIEWWQYSLLDENVERSDLCPFHHAFDSRSEADNDRSLISGIKTHRDFREGVSE